MPSFLCGTITLLSVAGINPMISVSIAAATLAQITIPGVSQREIALALLASWAISAVVGPFISTTVMASSVFDKALTTIAWRWNGLFGLVVLLTFCLLFYFVEF
jgi:MFS family permease